MEFARVRLQVPTYHQLNNLKTNDDEHTDDHKMHFDITGM